MSDMANHEEYMDSMSENEDHEDEGYLEFSQWERQVEETIQGDWLKTFKKGIFKEKFTEILEDLYGRYKPKENGEWDATPKWTEMFNWTGCPLRNIRAILLLKDPLPDDNRLYRSTGYAFGVQSRAPLSADEGIFNVATLRNFFNILHKAASRRALWEKQSQVTMKAIFQNGFNPGYMSRDMGILFLNVAPTRAFPDLARQDLGIWGTFLLEVVERVIRDSNCEVRVPLLQFYNNGKIQEFLSSETAEETLNTYIPAFMKLSNHGSKHIAYFTEEESKQYAAELTYIDYKAHRAILIDLFRITFAHVLATYRRPVNHASGQTANYVI